MPASFQQGSRCPTPVSLLASLELLLALSLEPDVEEDDVPALLPVLWAKTGTEIIKMAATQHKSLEFHMVFPRIAATSDYPLSGSLR
jgi:hypothetical protein